MGKWKNAATEEQHRAWCAKGGRNKPRETRGFCISRAIAVKAVKISHKNKSRDPKKKSFYVDRELASRAGKIGTIKALEVRRRNKLLREQAMRNAVEKKKRRVRREKWGREK